MNPHTILVHLQLLCAQSGKKLGFSWRVESSSKQLSLVTSQHPSIQSFAPSVTAWLKFEGAVVGSPILGAWGLLRGRDLHQWKDNPRLSNTSQ